jgi:hypothetical protein
MFRVVSEFVETPFYMVICDDPRCSTMYQHPLPAEDSQNPEGTAIKAAQEQGWRMSFGRQLCPGHNAQLKEIEARMNAGRERNLIVVPRKKIVSGS